MRDIFISDRLLGPTDFASRVSPRNRLALLDRDLALLEAAAAVAVVLFARAGYVDGLLVLLR